ncbi:MAG: YdcF family protein [Proteobacteria bacterium]|nr:YdcF family protein [Pseudomonadota bacterium]
MGVLTAVGLHDRLAPADLGVVLGSKVYPSGRPSPSLQARLEKTLELYRAGKFRTVMVSGGTGREGWDEAQVMRAWLVARGVPDTAIVVDSQGVDTLATARNASALMRARGFRSAMIVTQYFHVPRARLAMRKCGVAHLSWAHADLFELRDAFSLPREVVGYSVYWAGDCR